MSTFGRLRAHVGAYGLPVGCLQLLVVASAALRVFCSFRPAAFEVACGLPAGCPRDGPVASSLRARACPGRSYCSAW